MGIVNEAFSPTACASHHSHLHRVQRSPSSSHSHHHHQHRRRTRRNGSGGSSVGGSGNSSFHGAHGHSHSNTHDRSLTRHSHMRTAACARRHRSATDVSSNSVNASHDPITCHDREVQEIFVRKKCCSSSSRTELAQFFAEDLYGTSRRPSSCCTSSDYCYQTDSTSLYGSRSSLSRNNSIKSASVAMRKRRQLHQRQPSYTSISLRGLDSAHGNKQKNGLDRSKSAIGVGVADRAGSTGRLNSRVTFERKTSKDTLSQELPDYACSPSPIRWSFLEDDKSLTDLNAGKDETPRHSRSELGERDSKEKHQTPSRSQQSIQHSQSKPAQSKHQPQQQQQQKHYSQQAAFEDTNADSWESSYDECPTTTVVAAKAASLERVTPTNASTSKAWEPSNNNMNVHFADAQRRQSQLSCDFQETSTTTTILFHQEGEAFNNCCSNYIQCNTYLDQDLQITSEDIHQYLSKGNQQGDDILNNSKSYPFQPSNALEFQYKNNFANNNAATAVGGVESSDCCDSAYGYEDCYSHRRRRSSTKENKNSNQHSTGAEGTCIMSSCSSTPLSPTNINLSSSTNNINIIFGTPTSDTRTRSYNANEVKFINTTPRNNVVSSEAHHSGYLACNYPNYEYSNMSGNSTFDKTLDIDKISKAFEPTKAQSPDHTGTAGATGTGSSTSEGQHSSPLPSPLQASFESFDAPSDRHLISQRGSCPCSSPTPLSPLSPASPARSSMSATVLDSTAVTCICDNAQQPHHYCEYGQHQHHRHRSERRRRDQRQQQHHHQQQQQLKHTDCRSHQCHEQITTSSAATTTSTFSPLLGNRGKANEQSSSLCGHHEHGTHRHHVHMQSDDNENEAHCSCTTIASDEQQQSHNQHSQHSYQQQPEQHQHQHSHYHHHHRHRHQRQSLTDSFKLGNALKTVRKRARKYTEFLRKK